MGAGGEAIDVREQETKDRLTPSFGLSVESILEIQLLPKPLERAFKTDNEQHGLAIRKRQGRPTSCEVFPLLSFEQWSRIR